MSLYVRRVARDGSDLARYEDATKHDLLGQLGFVTCQTCNGSGTPLVLHKAATVLDTPLIGSEKVPCPDCLGLGVVPSDTMTERATEALLEADTANKWMPYFRDKARDALLAAFGGDELSKRGLSTSALDELDRIGDEAGYDLDLATNRGETR